MNNNSACNYNYNSFVNIIYKRSVIKILSRLASNGFFCMLFEEVNCFINNIYNKKIVLFSLSFLTRSGEIDTIYKKVLYVYHCRHLYDNIYDFYSHKIVSKIIIVMFINVQVGSQKSTFQIFVNNF